MTYILFRHLSGSKINQTDQFNLDDANELTLGRDPSCSIAYDPNKDDVVSRRHAVARVIKGEKLGFTLEDLNSANGTFLDGQKVTAEIELLPGQTIELGTGGPKLVFDVEPRPAHLMARTRMIKQPVGRETRLTDGASLNAPKEAAFTATTVSQSAAVKQGVGRETVERMLGEERKATSKTWMYALAGVLVIVAGVGAVLYVNTSRTAKDVQAQVQGAVGATASRIETQTAALSQRVENVQKTTPQQVVESYAKSTIMVNNIWRLYDRASGQQVFHKVYAIGRKQQWPAYIKMPCRPGDNSCRPQDGRIVRWLTTEGQPGIDEPISKDSQGSGFVVTAEGMILTNKHVAAGWLVRYNYGRYELESQTGVLVDMTVQRSKPIAPTLINPTKFEELSTWVPQDGGWLFHGDYPTPIYERQALLEGRNLEGRNEVLDICFQGDSNPVKARLIRASQDADVSLIKIDVSRPLKPVKLAPADYKPRLGEPITVLGYPAITPKKIQRTVGLEGGIFRDLEARVPEPTVTGGYISNIGEGTQQAGTVTTYGAMGDVYMLSDLATGSGNSGGPVFNGNGEVIGLFTYSLKEGEVRATFAVPIKYGHQIL